MPIEIRELIIKTEISTNDGHYTGGIKEKDLNSFKRQLLKECKRVILDNAKRNINKR
jgi:hypothetical protein